MSLTSLQIPALLSVLLSAAGNPSAPTRRGIDDAQAPAPPPTPSRYRAGQQQANQEPELPAGALTDLSSVIGALSSRQEPTQGHLPFAAPAERNEPSAHPPGGSSLEPKILAALLASRGTAEATDDAVVQQAAVSGRGGQRRGLAPSSATLQSSSELALPVLPAESVPSGSAAPALGACDPRVTAADRSNAVCRSSSCHVPPAPPTPARTTHGLPEGAMVALASALLQGMHKHSPHQLPEPSGGAAPVPPTAGDPLQMLLHAATDASDSPLARLMHTLDDRAPMPDAGAASPDDAASAHACLPCTGAPEHRGTGVRHQLRPGVQQPTTAGVIEAGADPGTAPRVPPGAAVLLDLLAKSLLAGRAAPSEVPVPAYRQARAGAERAEAAAVAHSSSCAALAQPVVTPPSQPAAQPQRDGSSLKSLLQMLNACGGSMRSGAANTAARSEGRGGGEVRAGACTARSRQPIDLTGGSASRRGARAIGGALAPQNALEPCKRPRSADPVPGGGCGSEEPPVGRRKASPVESKGASGPPAVPATPPTQPHRQNGTAAEAPKGSLGRIGERTWLRRSRERSRATRRHVQVRLCTARWSAAQPCVAAL
jgi:hypothetical protein